MKKLLMGFFLMVLPVQAMDTAKHVLALLSSRTRRPTASTRVTPVVQPVPTNTLTIAAPVVQALPKNEGTKSSTATIDAPRSDDSPKMEAPITSLTPDKDLVSLPREQINLSKIWKQQNQDGHVVIPQEDRPGFEHLKQHLMLAAVVAGMSDKAGQSLLKQSLAREMTNNSHDREAQCKLAAIIQFSTKYQMPLVFEAGHIAMFDVILKSGYQMSVDLSIIDDTLRRDYAHSILVSGDFYKLLAQRCAKSIRLKWQSEPVEAYAVAADGRTFATIETDGTYVIRHLNDKLDMISEAYRDRIFSSIDRFAKPEVHCSASYNPADIILKSFKFQDGRLLGLEIKIGRWGYIGKTMVGHDDYGYIPKTIACGLCNDDRIASTLNSPYQNHAWTESILHTANPIKDSWPLEVKESKGIISAWNREKKQLALYTTPHNALSALYNDTTPTQLLLLQQLLTNNQTLSQTLELHPSLVKVAESLDEGNLKGTGVLQLIKDL